MTATLGTFRRARPAQQSPALLVVGDVVALQAALAWFGAGAAEDCFRKVA